MPGEPRVFNRASKAATRCCNWAIVACCSAMIISRASRLAVARSSFVSTPLVYHDYTTNARIFPASLDLFTSSNLNTNDCALRVDIRQGGC